jgi:hypothetical protein
MWLDVIADCRWCYDGSLQTILTKRMLEQLVPPDSSPASRRVPLIPLRRLAANAHGSTYHPRPKQQGSRCRSRKAQTRPESGGRCTRDDPAEASSERLRRLPQHRCVDALVRRVCRQRISDSWLGNLRAHSRSDIRDACGLLVATGAEL